MDQVFVLYSSKQDIFSAAASKEFASGSGHTEGELKITKVEKLPSRADCIEQVY